MDHSNTRLASQLDRNPGSPPSLISVADLEFFGGWFFKGERGIWEMGWWVSFFFFPEDEFSYNVFFFFFSNVNGFY